MLQDTGWPLAGLTPGRRNATAVGIGFHCLQEIGWLVCEMKVSRCFLQGVLRRYTGHRKGPQSWYDATQPAGTGAFKVASITEQAAMGTPY